MDTLIYAAYCAFVVAFYFFVIIGILVVIALVYNYFKTKRS